MSSQVKVFKQNFHLKANGKLLDLSTPKVMGIVNLTPDSFYAGSRIKNHAKLLKTVSDMVEHGASVIDIGAVSTRPGASLLSEDVELRRLLPPLRLIRSTFPEVFISIDTFRSQVALAAAECGADIINDIYSGRFDEKMLKVVSSLKLPYVIMHMQGDPASMQINPVYKQVVREIKSFFSDRIKAASGFGIKQIIIDPGFGFGKSVKDNFIILKNIKNLDSLGYPILAGVSRKSMINRILEIKPVKALNGTTVLNTLALMNGASVLRVHDVKQAVEAVRLYNFYKSV